jgi:hypothetical protein
LTNKRDNEEERVARVEHVLSRLTDTTAASERMQHESRQLWSDVQSARERRSKIVDSVRSVLKPKRTKRKTARHAHKKSSR